MSYQIILSEKFKKATKNLRKKYKSFDIDFEQFLDSLENDPIQGSSLGRNCYKVRMKISSKGQGKSGGARVITYVLIQDE